LAQIYFRRWRLREEEPGLVQQSIELAAHARQLQAPIRRASGLIGFETFSRTRKTLYSNVKVFEVVPSITTAEFER
jgi:hypothetical protein